MDCVHTWLASLDLHVGEHEWSLPISSLCRQQYTSDDLQSWTCMLRDGSMQLASFACGRREAATVCSAAKLQKWIDRIPAGTATCICACMAHTHCYRYSPSYLYGRTHVMQMISSRTIWPTTHCFSPWTIRVAASSSSDRVACMISHDWEETVVMAFPTWLAKWAVYVSVMLL